MTVLFDGVIDVCYGQFYLSSTDRGYFDQNDPFMSAFRGQSNGLCGAADRGGLFLITGLHTGHVSLRVNLLESEPPVDESWQEIVEVSLAISSDKVFLVDWNGQDYPIALPPNSYRARYHANYMDEAHHQDTILPDEQTIDRYYLQLWSGQLRTGLILKQTSEMAAYWHEWVLESAVGCAEQS